MTDDERVLNSLFPNGELSFPINPFEIIIGKSNNTILQTVIRSLFFFLS